MSYGNKDNGRDYSNRTSSIQNKMQSITNRNINLSQQYNNSDNGDNYSYDLKSQRVCNSPKQSGETHNNNQPNSHIREHFSYKNDNQRTRHFPSKYNNEKPNYFSQQSNASSDVVIPAIDQLKEFIKEQSDQFKSELAKYEDRKSCSPSPRNNFNLDQTQPRAQQRPPTGQNRIGSGMSASNSMGTIACSNNSFSTVSSFSSTTMSNSDKQSNSYSAKCNYNKTVQPSGKSNNLLSRNLSHDETFSKVSPINKNRVSSPKNIENSPANKMQYSPSFNMGVLRQDNKSDINKSNKYVSYSMAPAMNSQQNTNNPIMGLSYAEDARKMNQQARQVVSNGKAGGSNSFDTYRNPARMNGEESLKSHRVEVRISSSGNATTGSQDNIECCAEDSQIDDNRTSFGPRTTKKAI